MISPTVRHMGLFLALLVSLAAAWWAPDSEEEQGATVVAVAARTRPHQEERAVPAQPTGLDLDRLGRRSPTDTDADPFRAKSWYVAPPPPPPAPPPKPAAPPMPFQYVGKFDDAGGGNLVVYLAKGSESYAVKPGDKFADDYRFEGIEKGQVMITYLPMSLKQRLPMGASE
jgi:hypothetical protein